MNQNKAVVYCVPDFLIDTENFHKHIKIGIKIKGYNMIRQNNLLVCIGFLGKLSNTSNTQYKLKVDQAIEILGSKGIQTIQVKTYDPEDLAGLEWEVDFLDKPSFVPRENKIYIRQDGKASLKFTNYRYQNLGNGNSETEERQNNMAIEVNDTLNLIIEKFD